MNITLTDDQRNAVSALTAFLANDNEHAFVLRGYAGTGKSTLVHYILDNIQKIMTAIRTVDINFPHYSVELTATTNKAADNLAHITQQEVRTIHSFLGLQVETDYRTRKTNLVCRKKIDHKNIILFIDEASFIDSELLNWVFKKLKNSKIVFIGDPAQLIPVKSAYAPVFKASFPSAELTNVTRQAAGNPILELATKFRHAVNTGEFFSFKPDGHHIQHLPREDFYEVIKQDFSRADWNSQQSQVLAWTNKTVEEYNKAISGVCKGRTNFQAGDFVQSNKFYCKNKQTIKADQQVLVTGVGAPDVLYGVPGHVYTLNHTISAFCPDSLVDKSELLKRAKAADEFAIVREIEEDWIDLRPVYARTINKSQGSTYDRVYIDLDDIKKCTNADVMARLLYVGTSRPRHQLFLTGDLV